MCKVCLIVQSRPIYVAYGCVVSINLCTFVCVKPKKIIYEAKSTTIDGLGSNHPNTFQIRKCHAAKG